MPRISDAYTRNAIYIYDSAEDAEQGRGIGGSGFLVDVPSSSNPDKRQIYAVTNKHAILATPSPVIRLNKSDGSVGGFVTKPSDWTSDPLGDDIAVLHLNVGLS